MNSIAVYTKDPVNNLSQIQDIKSKNPESDFFIFSDFFMKNGGSQNLAILSTFYMKFFKGTVYFLNKEDYESNRYATIADCLLIGEIS